MNASSGDESGAPDASWWRSSRHDPGAAAALASLEAALRRGTKLSRLRALRISCPRAHTVAQVLRTPAGPVLFGRAAAVEGHSEEDGTETVTRVRAREGQLAVLLDAGDDDDEHVEAQCRCGLWLLRLGWVREQVAAGRKAALLTQAWNPS